VVKINGIVFLGRGRKWRLATNEKLLHGQILFVL
jgi:hypothetical protein